jgi:hypothetical protein
LFEADSRLERIEGYAFSGCSSLVSLFVPDLVTIDQLSLARSSIQIQRSLPLVGGLVLDSSGRHLLLCSGFHSFHWATPSVDDDTDAAEGKDDTKYPYYLATIAKDSHKFSFPETVGKMKADIPSSVEFVGGGGAGGHSFSRDESFRMTDSGNYSSWTNRAVNNEVG